MTIVMNGSLLAEKIIEDLKAETQTLDKKPHLVVFQVGNNPAGKIYVSNKQKKAEYIGFRSTVIPLPSDISEDSLFDYVNTMSDNKDVNAILIQLPLPEYINQQKIIEIIDPIKDVDCFTSYNFGWLALGYNPYVTPCTPTGIIRLLDEYKIDLEGKNVIVIGRSNIVGKPLSLMLQERHATVTMAHSRTENLAELSSTQDIIISATGFPKLIKENFVKEGAVVVDVGITRVDDTILGDVDFDNVKDKTSYITQVPGGIGPMTIAMLMENTLKLFKIQKGFFNM